MLFTPFESRSGHFKLSSVPAHLGLLSLPSDGCQTCLLLAGVVPMALGLLCQQGCLLVNTFQLAAPCAGATAVVKLLDKQQTWVLEVPATPSGRVSRITSSVHTGLPSLSDNLTLTNALASMLVCLPTHQSLGACNAAQPCSQEGSVLAMLQAAASCTAAGAAAQHMHGGIY